jgi:hypothetical protein
MDLDKILNLALNKALIGKNRIKHINSNEIADFVNKHLEAINYTRCSIQLKSKKELTFKEWRKKNKYTKCTNGTYYVNHEVGYLTKTELRNRYFKNAL